VASTDQRAVDIDTEQYRSGDSPCFRAAKTGEPVRMDMAAARALWPQFAGSARSLGAGSYLAVPLTVDGGLSGAMNLFGFGPNGFREAVTRLVELYTTVVVFGLRSARRYMTDQLVVRSQRGNGKLHDVATRFVAEGSAAE
jgi:hypothetical protein